jgi:HNH endonuclease
VITLERVREAFDYDPETGILTRRIQTSYNRKDRVGKPAGGKSSNGYLSIDIDQKRFLAHRLIWFHVYGVWPSSYIDHINRDPADNRLCNLRLATNSQNQANRPAPKNNTSGFKGVSWHEQAKKWRSAIWVRGRNKELGEFRNFEIACAVYVEAAIEHFGEFAHVD